MAAQRLKGSRMGAAMVSGLNGVAIERRLLRLGPLLAEGGEGKVFELADDSTHLFKFYRSAALRRPLEELVRWPETMAGENPSRAARLRSSTAWPDAVVIDSAPSGSGTSALSGGGNAPARGQPVAVGVIMPKAPARFFVRHRDGANRLATLSYLTADPAERAAAYGVALPAVASPERIGLVYALARLIQDFQGSPGAVSVAHGDLSTKNVLWSLHPSPEVFVIDCDNAERYGADGSPLGGVARRRAMTPNWDDPAVPAGSNPGLCSDRYSLALIFLRVVGAAHFPIQKRQRAGEVVGIDFAMPKDYYRCGALGRGAELWRLCERSLSIRNNDRRPSSEEWVAVLEHTLQAMGATSVLHSIWRNQEESPSPLALSSPGRPGPSAPSPGRPSDNGRPTHEEPEREVVITPVLAEPRYLNRSWAQGVLTAPAGATGGSGTPGTWQRGPGWRPGYQGASGGAWRPGQVQVGSGGVPGVPVVPGGGVGSGAGGFAQGIAPGQAGSGGPSVARQLSEQLVAASRWWLVLHRRMARAIRTRGRRGLGLRRLAFCILLDVAVAAMALFLYGMIVSPFLGI